MTSVGKEAQTCLSCVGRLNEAVLGTVYTLALASSFACRHPMIDIWLYQRRPNAFPIPGPLIPKKYTPCQLKNTKEPLRPQYSRSRSFAVRMRACDASRLELCAAGSGGTG